MNNSLFQIKQEYAQILQTMDEELITTGQVSEDTETALAVVQETLVEKSVNYKWAIDIFQSQVDLADAEIKRVQAFKERTQAKQNMLRKALLQALLEFGEEDKKGVKKLSNGTITLSTRKSTSIEIKDESEVPEKYKTIEVKIPGDRVKVVKAFLDNLKIEYKESNPVVSKTLIKEDLKSGVVVPGAEEVTKLNLTIK